MGKNTYINNEVHNGIRTVARRALLQEHIPNRQYLYLRSFLFC